jgi:serine/threonine protein kinase
MIDCDGNIKLIDFGYAKVLDKAKTFSICGTNSYMSPDLIMGQQKGYSFEADWWSFGVLLFQM